jgi:hypothetical protein
MAIFAIEKYELHSQVYYVEADNLAKAILAVDERGVSDDNGPSLLQTADTNGMEDNQLDVVTLAELRVNHFDLDDGIVRGIRSAEALSPGSEEYQKARYVLQDLDLGDA